MNIAGAASGKFSGTVFNNNTASNGGGIYSTATGKMDMEYCTFDRNEANTAGGRYI